MKAAKYLEDGLHILVQRGAERNDPEGENSFGNILEIFKAISPTGKLETEYDVAQFLVALKLARLRQNPFDHDSAVDAINYLALSGQCLHSEVSKSIRNDPYGDALGSLPVYIRKAMSDMLQSREPMDKDDPKLYHGTGKPLQMGKDTVTINNTAGSSATRG